MKKMKKLSAAVALALSMGVVSHAHAAITLKSNGKGDALLFPVYNAYVENYFTISNNENKWIQGHLRFRGAAWSGELLDFDVILSPGDVFVFRVADVDGDGQWEVDQSLDEKNFMYTAQVAKCGSSADSGTSKKDKCLDFSTILVPSTRSAVLTQPIVEHHVRTGYIEFIGEAVLDGMTAEKMMALLSDKPGDLAKYQTTVGNRRGVSAWSWSDAAHQFKDDMGLSDVPNALSGTAFITMPGSSQGLAYNAEALADFRTGITDHRIDNYRMLHNPEMLTYAPLDDEEKDVKANRAVIVHDENVSGVGTGTPYKPYGDYVFRFEPFNSFTGAKTVGKVPKIDVNGLSDHEEDRLDESRMSFQNTWGPTLADGDDYLLAGLRPAYGNAEDDDFDANWLNNPYGLGVPNSVAEVEEAIREDGQSFTAYYFGEGMLTGAESTLSSQYFVHFPTKVFWSEMYDEYGATSLGDFVQKSAQWLLSKSKRYQLELWDTQEREACRQKAPDIGITSPYSPGAGSTGCVTTTSPSTGCEAPEVPVVVIEPCKTDLGFELNFFDINNIKAKFPAKEDSGIDVMTEFKSGRVVFEPMTNYDDSFQNNLRQSWPALMYTFELGDDWSLGQWRSMQR